MMSLAALQRAIVARYNSILPTGVPKRVQRSRVQFFFALPTNFVAARFDLR